MNQHPWLESFKACFNNEQVVAYPTEAVYGLGCNPLSQKAMDEILRLKVRPVEKGVIIIAADVSQIMPFVDWDAIPLEHQQKIEASWPGPFTWLMPKSDKTPAWISGDSPLIAVRVTDHSLVIDMCNAVGSALVSTSANPAGLVPARSAIEVENYFQDQILIIDGPLGSQQKPSTITNSLTLERLR